MHSPYHRIHAGFRSAWKIALARSANGENDTDEWSRRAVLDLPAVRSKQRASPLTAGDFFALADDTKKRVLRRELYLHKRIYIYIRDHVQINWRNKICPCVRLCVYFCSFSNLSLSHSARARCVALILEHHSLAQIPRLFSAAQATNANHLCSVVTPVSLTWKYFRKFWTHEIFVENFWCKSCF